MTIRDRFERLYHESLEDQEWLRQQPKREDYDRTGNATSGEMRDHHFFAIAEYILHGDVTSFRRHLIEAAKLRISLFDRYDAGTLQDDSSYVTMNAQDQLFDVLAAGDFVVAEAFARRLGGRLDIEKENDLPIRWTLGYTLKYCVLNDLDAFQRWLPQLQNACQNRKCQGFEGFAVVFRAILERNLTQADAGMLALADGHRRLSRDHAWFAETEDELLSIWGIGMANLARHRGLNVSAIPPYIPADLLVDAKQS